MVLKTTLNGQSNPTVFYLVATCLGLEIDHHQSRHTVITMEVINAIYIIECFCGIPQVLTII
jgi:hypothetical protein